MFLCSFYKSNTIFKYERCECKINLKNNTVSIRTVCKDNLQKLRIRLCHVPVFYLCSTKHKSVFVRFICIDIIRVCPRENSFPVKLIDFSYYVVCSVRIGEKNHKRDAK